MSEAHAEQPEVLTEPLTWPEICALYPDQWVALVEMDVDEDTDELTTARVAYCGANGAERSRRCTASGCAPTRSGSRRSSHFGAGTITLPLYKGLVNSTGKTVYYVLTDTSDPGLAGSLGLNYSAKLNPGFSIVRSDR